MTLHPSTPTKGLIDDSLNINFGSSTNNIALIGCGPHAKRIYVGYMVARGIEPTIIVDIKSKRDEILTIIKNNGWTNTATFFLDPTDIYTPFSKTEKKALIALLKSLDITEAVISTCPEVHTPYAELCLSVGIRTLIDKPLSAPRNISLGNSNSLLDDIRSLLEYDKGENIVIQCQRRRHEGYMFVKNLIKEINKEYGIQPHFIDIYHSDGRWDFPDEIPRLNNHPYMTGYGKLLHSGYHFVDLITYLTDFVDYDGFQLYSYKNNIHDFKAQIPDEFYKKTFGIDNQFDFFGQDAGEVDSYSLIQMKQSNLVKTTVSLNLLHTGFSRRAWGKAKADLYKGNGRLRHERVNIQIGPLMNIQIHSYQSTETHEAQTINKTDTGGLEHFDIHIYRNNELIGGVPYEKIQLKDIETVNSTVIGQNENARYQLVDDFLQGKPSDSGLRSHIRTNILLAAIAKSAYEGIQIDGAFTL